MLVINIRRYSYVAIVVASEEIQLVKILSVSQIQKDKVRSMIKCNHDSTLELTLAFQKQGTCPYRSYIGQ